MRTRYTGLSVGTELSFLNATNPALSSSFDPELGLFRTDPEAAQATRPADPPRLTHRTEGPYHSPAPMGSSAV